MPEITPIKVPKPRGGKRPGAGRKPNYFKRLQIKPMTAAEVLARCCNEVDAWKWFLTHKDPDIRLKAFVFQAGLFTRTLSTGILDWLRFRSKSCNHSTPLPRSSRYPPQDEAKSEPAIKAEIVEQVMTAGEEEEESH